MTEIRPKVQWFLPETRQKIFEEATDVLAKLGVFVENPTALELLDGAGARIDRSKGRAYIPALCVRKALDTVPHRIEIFDRKGKVAMDLGEDRIHFNPGSAALRIYDFVLGEARLPLTRDLVDFAIVADALPHLAAQSTALVPADVPQEIADRYRLYVILRHSTKPVVTGTFCLDGFHPMHEMLSLVAGGSENLRKKPTAIFDCCPSPPLTWSNLTCQALIDCAQTGVPAELVSMPLTGATSPVTLAGAVVQHCAESLSGVVIHQLAGPGSPIIYGGSPAFFDMRKGTTPMGAVETMMIDGAYSEIGKHLGIPTHAYMALSDSKPVDFQAGMETAMGAIIAAVSGINNISGPGMLDFETCQSLEKLVLDHEICGMAKRLEAGVAVREDPLAIHVLEEGIEAKDFLCLPHTLKWFREEAYVPDSVIDRGSFEDWRQKGRNDAARRASERVGGILQAHVPEPLDRTVADGLRELMLSEAKKCGLQELPSTKQH